jgi:predicted GIY-YIG superfamily endonuclease
MHWVYILRCEDGYYYVGETSRLFRRFWEHEDGIGGLNTATYSPECIVAIYKAVTLDKFIKYNSNVLNTMRGETSYHRMAIERFDEDSIDYDYLGAENNIAECMMLHNPLEWQKIRGGKYTRFDARYKFPENDNIKQLPLCNCGLPCDVRKNEQHSHLYFRCAKKNMWGEFREMFDIEEYPCNFYAEYVTDKPLRLHETIRYADRKQQIRELMKSSFWLRNIPEFDNRNPTTCVGGCHKTYTNYSKISYDFVERALCWDCFVTINDQLKSKYDQPSRKGVCLVKI